MISAFGLPFPPLAFAAAVAAALGGGVLLIAGYRMRFVAIALAVFSLATAVSFHHDLADQNQMIHFLKNLMIAGVGSSRSRHSGRAHSASIQRMGGAR